MKPKQYMYIITNMIHIIFFSQVTTYNEGHQPQRVGHQPQGVGTRGVDRLVESRSTNGL